MRAVSEEDVDLSMLPEKFVVFDLETTGFSPRKNEIIEIGAVKINRDFDNHEIFQALIKPNKEIPRKITEMTGITQEMVDNEGENLASALEEFVNFIEDLRLVAYNADFDMRFIKEALMSHDITIKNPVSCALKMARRAWPGLKSYKLKDIANIRGLSTEGNHRALKDCELTITVYSEAAAELGSVK